MAVTFSVLFAIFGGWIIGSIAAVVILSWMSNRIHERDER